MDYSLYYVAHKIVSFKNEFGAVTLGIYFRICKIGTINEESNMPKGEIEQSCSIYGILFLFFSCIPSRSFSLYLSSLFIKVSE